MNELILVSKDVEYFYQYPTIDEMERGLTEPKKRLVSEISNSLPK